MLCNNIGKYTYYKAFVKFQVESYLYSSGSNIIVQLFEFKFIFGFVPKLGLFILDSEGLPRPFLFELSFP